MDRVLELLSTESDAGIEIAASILSPELIAASPEPLKHKLKTLISAMLKSTGKTRAYGAVLARIAIADWSIINSHGASWAIILLHILDLPDHVCWLPVTKTLAVLFSAVQGKTDLMREIAGSKIGDFMKRLVATIPVTRAYFAVSAMLNLYPTQCRPYINKIEPLLKLSHKPEATYALVSLCIAEKQSSDVWKTQVAARLNALSPTNEERELSTNCQCIAGYIDIAVRIRAPVPAQLLFNKIWELLASFRPHAVLVALTFIQRTFSKLHLQYLQKFDALLYKLSEVLEMGNQFAVQALAVVNKLLASAGWVPDNYTKLITRLARKAINMLMERENTAASGASGLADYVQNPAAFARSTLTESQVRILVDFLTTAMLSVGGIPQSVRVLMDKQILQLGNHRQVALATLYPGKFSIIPLAVGKSPTLEGFEALVHPRFPPLRVSKHVLESREAEDIPEAPTEASIEVPVEVVEESVNELAEEEVEDATIEQLPSIPESTKPVHRTELNTPPEKRVKRDLPSVHVPVTEPEPEPEPEAMESDEDLVIPTLTMDSD